MDLTTDLIMALVNTLVAKEIALEKMQEESKLPVNSTGNFRQLLEVARQNAQDSRQVLIAAIDNLGLQRERLGYRRGIDEAQRQPM